MNDPLFFRGRTGVTSIHLPPSDPLAVSNQVREHASNAELESEQAYIDHAYACLERTRHAISALKDTTDSGPGGTFQARYERDVIYDQVAQRLSQLDLGDQSLVFGRIDKAAH